jgi:serine/threonine protein kinase
MAPEIRSHYREGTQPPKHKDLEVNMKQDIYSLGLILYEICHKMRTGMMRSQLFRQLDKNREIPEQAPIKTEHIEHKMILAMTA